MSLMICPECANEISTTADACPNCGRPTHAPVVPIVPPERKVVVMKPEEKEGFPTWALIPIGLLVLILIFVLYAVFNRDDDGLANDKINVNINAARAASNGSRSSTTIEPSTATIPSAPGYVPPASSGGTSTSTTTVPGAQTSVEPSAGTVSIDAKVVTERGSTQAVRNEKFYLLDRDVESILSSANLDAIDGQSLTNSLGLSILFPSRYGDFRRDALAAINRHIKYSGQTDGAGKAKLSGVEPNSYYLFGMTKSGNGFAVWSSPVSIQKGENVLNLSPARLTSMQSPQ